MAASCGGRVSGLVGRHARRVWVVTALALLAAGAFLPTFKAEGNSQEDLFLNEVESVTGQEVLARHFPAGPGTPVQIIAPAAEATAVLNTTRQLDGISSVTASVVPGQPPKVVDGRSVAAGNVGAGRGLAGGDQSDRVAPGRAGPDRVRRAGRRLDRDQPGHHERQQADLRVIIPAILGVIFVVLMLLLRSVTAAVLLVAANVISFGATVGVSAIVFNYVFDFPGADPSIPLYAFVFLVALGIDYSIFLMTRVRGVDRTRHQTGHPGRACRHRRRDHLGRDRARGDVLRARRAADTVPGADRVHGRVRRAAGHHGRPLAAGPGPVLRHRPQRLVAYKLARAKQPTP